jgi:hypothetical protein
MLTLPVLPHQTANATLSLMRPKIGAVEHKVSGIKLKIAAVRSGTDPIGPLPSGSFPTTLDAQLVCPKCDATYSLIADWDQANDRRFEERSQPLIRMLKKSVMLSHGNDHRVTHFETEGVVVLSLVRETPSEPKFLTRTIQ